MDTAELLEKLRIRIEETTRDRDRLAETIGALNAAIVKQAEEERVVTRLVARFEHIPSSIPEQSDSEETTNVHGIEVTWPVGPEFTKQIKVKKIKAWARFKLASADWYLDTLRAISQEGELRRVLGVEMAVDGIVQSLCAAFDAAVFALTRAVERAANIPDDRRTPVHLATWSNLAAETKYLDVDLACSLSISDAVVGEHSESPQGWLAQLMVLRQRSARQDLLVDDHPETTDSSGLCIDVPYRGSRSVLGYLSETRDLVGELLETIMHDLADAKSGRLRMAGPDILRERAEREMNDLLRSDDAP